MPKIKGNKKGFQELEKVPNFNLEEDSESMSFTGWSFVENSFH